MSKTRSASSRRCVAVELRPVQLEVAHHAVRDTEHRVHRAVGVLEDHRHLAAVPEDILARAQLFTERPR